MSPTAQTPKSQWRPSRRQVLRMTGAAGLALGGLSACSSSSSDGKNLVLAVTPEYNATMPAVLNNAIDWLSRPYGVGALAGKPFGVIGVTPTPYGGVCALSP